MYVSVCIYIPGKQFNEANIYWILACPKSFPLRQQVWKLISCASLHKWFRIHIFKFTILCTSQACPECSYFPYRIPLHLKSIGMSCTHTALQFCEFGPITSILRSHLNHETVSLSIVNASIHGNSLAEWFGNGELPFNYINNYLYIYFLVLNFILNLLAN